MNSHERIQQIALIDDYNQFHGTLWQYLFEKKFKTLNQLTETEETVFGLISMETSIMSDGFVDLFCQQYSLEQCIRIEKALRVLGLNNLADLFLEAKLIFIGHNTGISEEE